MLCLGDVLWKPPEEGQEVPHCYVVASDPSIDAESVVLLPFTSWEEYKDDSCVVTPEEYRPLNHNSCIDYRNAEIVGAATLIEKCMQGAIRKNMPVSSDVLQKIWDGAKDTRSLSPRCLALLEKQALLN